MDRRARALRHDELRRGGALRDPLRRGGISSSSDDGGVRGEERRPIRAIPTERGPLPAGRPPGRGRRPFRPAGACGDAAAHGRRGEGPRRPEGAAAGLAAARAAFYEGDIAQTIAAYHREHGGWLTAGDLARLRGDLRAAGAHDLRRRRGLHLRPVVHGPAARADPGDPRRHRYRPAWATTARAISTSSPRR